MPILTKTPFAIVVNIHGAALLRTADGEMRALKIGDIVRDGDAIITSQDGIVEMRDTRGDSRVAELEFEAPAAGLGGGDGGDLQEGLRVGRVAESLATAGTLDAGTSPERLAPAFVDYRTGAAAASPAPAPAPAPQNAAPTATPTAVSGNEDASLPVPAGGQDSDGTVVGVTIASLPSTGALALADGTPVVVGQTLTPAQAAGLVYTPPADFQGTTEYSYTVTDDDGAVSAPATTTIGVLPVNDLPVARPDALATDEDTPLVIAPAALLGNDSDGDGDTLTIVAVGNPTGGSVAIVDGQVVFTPTPDHHGAASFSYTVSDGHGGTSSASVSVTVRPANDAPVARDDNAATPEDTPVTVAVLGNDSDADGDALSVTGANALHGSVVVNADGTLGYTPAADFNGTDTIVYTIADGHGGVSSATVTVSVTPVNDTPNPGNDNSTGAADDALTTDEDTALTIAPATLLTNDVDLEADALSIVSVQGATHGSVALVGGNVVFTPAANYTGPASFAYTVSDGNGGTATATVNVAVRPVNDNPNPGNDNTTGAADDALATDEDTALTLAPATLLANDVDLDGDTLSIVSVQGASNGSVALVAGNVVFTPAANYNGPASFTYTVSDSHGATATATVNVAVRPVNDAPNPGSDNSTGAYDDALSAQEDQPLTIAPSVLLANDVDADGDALSIVAVQDAANGTVQLVGGNVVFTPAPGYNGPASFTYTVSDGQGGTATASVGIVVNPINDPPAASNDSTSTAEDTPLTLAPAALLSNDSDPDGDALSIVSVQDASHGSVQLVGGNVVFTPAANYHGPASFTYTVSDGKGGTATATVSVAVTPVNDAPNPGNDNSTGAADDALATDEDNALTIAPATLLANDVDLDGDTLSIVSVQGATNGSVAMVGGNVVFTPAANYNGAASFTYTVSDGSGGTATATVNVAVRPVNDGPDAGNDNSTGAAGDALATDEDTALTIVPAVLLANDIDLDGDTLSIVSVQNATNGSVALVGGNVVFTPAANYNGPASFTYTVSDGNGGTATATVNVAVRPVNDNPNAGTDNSTGAADDALATDEDTALTIAPATLLANDVDVDGDALTIVSVQGATHGSVALVAGNVVFTPAANYNGPASFTYTVSDGNGGTATATVNVLVSPLNDAPTAADDAFAVNEDTALMLAPAALLANDGDVDGDALTIVSVQDATHGSVQLVDGSVVFTPASNYNGPASFTYTVSDGHGGTATATAHITVQPVDDAPVVGTGSGSVIENEQPVASGDLDATDIDNPSLAFVPATLLGSYGSLVIGADGAWTYTLDARAEGLAQNEAASEAFVVALSDGSTTTVSIGITGRNDTTVVGTASAVLSEEGLVTGNADTVGSPDSGNARTASGSIALADADGDALTLTLTAPVTPLTSGGVPITWSGAGTQTLVGSAGGRPILTVTIADNGSWTATLDGPVDHAAAGEDVRSFGIGVVVNDGTGSTSTTLTVGIDDDSPIFVAAPQAGVIANEPGAALIGDLGLRLGADDGAGAKASFSVTSVDAQGFILATHIGFDGLPKTQQLTYQGMKLHFETDPATGSMTARATDGTAVFTADSVPPGGAYRISFLQAVDATNFTATAFNALSAGNTPNTYTLSDVQNAFTAYITGTANGAASTVNTSQGYIGVANQWIGAADQDVLTLDFGTRMHAIGMRMDGLGNGESMVWKAYDANGTLVGTGSVAGAKGNADTSATLSAADFAGGVFSKLTLEAGAGEYRVALTSISGETELVSQQISMGVVVQDADGDSTAQQSFTVSLESDATLAAPTAGGALGGSAANETLNGSAARDVMSGGGGNDVLNGNDGHDVLIGGSGNDTLDGGLGNDVFAWRLADAGTPSAPAVDQVAGFSNAAGTDVLDLRDLLQGETTANLSAYLHFSSVGGSTTISISSSGGFAGGYNAAAVDQVINVSGVDLVAGFGSDSSVINDLLARGKLLVDQPA
jgi:VCBS repeat-containing protein